MGRSYSSEGVQVRLLPEQFSVKKEGERCSLI